MLITNKNVSNINDYSVYRFTSKELIVCIARYLTVCTIVGATMYDSVFVTVLFMTAMPFYLKRCQDKAQGNRKRQLEKQFRDCVIAVEANLQAGYSVENAFKEASQDIVLLHGEECDMARELALLNQKLRMNQELETILQDFAKRSGQKDIQDFADIFSIAKKSGGSMKDIIVKTSSAINSKARVREELDTILTQKKLEQNIMRIIPFGMVIYIRITNKGYFEILYHNPVGFMVVTFCLGLYIAANILMDRILDIKI